MNWYHEFDIIDGHAHIGTYSDGFGVSLLPQELRKLMKEYSYSRSELPPGIHVMGRFF